MTRVKITREGERYALICRGHATGSKEMCAAVSCLVYSAAGWLHNTEWAELLEEKLSPGDAEISFEGAGTKFLGEFLTIAFLQLEQYDPEHICVEAEV